MRLPRRLGHGEGAELVERLGELRSRLFVCIAAVAAGFVAGYLVHARLVQLLEPPLPGDRKLVTYGVAEPFLTSIQVSLAAGLAIALPIVLWQLWSFFAPAFQPHLQRAIAACVAFATVLFAGGLAFGYGVALPAGLKYLTTYDHALYTIQIRARDYISFSITVLVAVGIVFELPAVIVTLVRLGILSSRTLRTNRRIGYVIVAAIAVALPGVDPITTAMEMAPLMLLFEASIWLSVLAERRRNASIAEARWPVTACGRAGCRAEHLDSPLYMPCADQMLAVAASRREVLAASGVGARPLRKVAVLTCMDARIEPFILLGLARGDAHVIRNAGGVVTDDVLRSLSVSQRLLGTEEIVVVMHDGCGLHGASESRFAEELAADGVAPSWRLGAFDDLEETLCAGLARLRSSCELPVRDQIRGFIFDLESGVLREVGD